MQLTADIFGLPASGRTSTRPRGLGAAIDCAVGARPARRLPDRGARDDAQRAAPSSPIAANAALYDELYEQVYRRMYKGLAPLYARIRPITGYPPAD